MLLEESTWRKEEITKALEHLDEVEESINYIERMIFT
jgi:hypothetical protein